MSEADALFDYLNYKKYDNHPEGEITEENVWTTQDCRMIEYTAEEVIKGNHCKQRITFDVNAKRIICGAFLNNRGTRAIPFSPLEIYAMSLKCKELRVVR